MKKLKTCYGNELKIRECIEKYKVIKGDNIEREKVLEQLYDECKKVISWYVLKRYGLVKDFEEMVHQAATDIVISVIEGKVDKFATKYLEGFIKAYVGNGKYSNSRYLNYEDLENIEIGIDGGLEDCVFNCDVDNMLIKIESFLNKYKIDGMYRNLLWVRILSGYSLSVFGLDDIESLVIRIYQEIRG
jgi:hypothetical protein